MARTLQHPTGMVHRKCGHSCQDSSCAHMSAVELLKQVEAMPARERERFLLALFKLEGKPTHAKPKSRRVKWPDIEARTKRIFGERVFPNLVLLERGKPKFVVSKGLIRCTSADRSSQPAAVRAAALAGQVF